MAAPYTPTIGLEIHAELKTKTKMFCSSRNNPDEEQPNANTCPVCLAHPGTLPTINKEAVRQVLRVGTALKATIADYTEFDRKSYFYPDIPKGYQISQYEHPLVAGGELAGVAVTRVHLEEDTARSSHAGGNSLVDFNRAGVPLMELVTEPVIHDAVTAGKFARELQLLLRSLGASDANLEKGEMRIEANISVSNSDALGTKVEVKNLNSFRSVERAIAFEIDRQIKALEAGEKVVQETRGWDESKQKTFHQRFKEGSADYRYFPEPDLPKLLISEVPEFNAEVLTAGIPELPWEKRERLINLGLKDEEAEMLLTNDYLRTLFEGVTAHESKKEIVRLAANYILSDVAALIKEEASATITAEKFLELVRMIAANEISSRGAKDILAHMHTSGDAARVIAEREGLLQVSDASALTAIVEEVIAANPAAVREYQGGKENALQYLLGQAMRTSKGAGNPTIFTELLVTKIGK